MSTKRLWRSASVSLAAEKAAMDRVKEAFDEDYEPMPGFSI